MKKISIVLIALLSCTAIFAQEINDPNAEIREAKNFHALKVSNAFDVYLTQGSEEAVAVSANDDEVKQHIRVDVDGGVLLIWLEGEKKFWKFQRTYYAKQLLMHVRIGIVLNMVHM